MPAIGGLSFRRSVSATAHFRSQVRLRGICLCTKIPESRDTETGSMETRFDVALTRSEAKDSPLARPLGRQIGKTGHARAMGKPAVNRGLDEIGGEEGERECPVHVSDAALLALADAFRARCWIGDEFIEPEAATCDRCNEGGSILLTVSGAPAGATCLRGSGSHVAASMPFSAMAQKERFPVCCHRPLILLEQV